MNQRFNNRIRDGSIERLVIGTMMILFAMLIVISFPMFVSADEKAKLIINAPSEAPKAGESFNISVCIADNPGFNSIQFELIYDKSSIKCEKAYVGNMLSNAFASANVSDNGEAILAAASSDSIKENDVLVTFKCTALKDVTDYKLSVKNVVLGDYNYNDIPYSVLIHDNSGNNSGGNSESIKPDNEKNMFPDTVSHWGKEYIQKAADIGLFKGYADGSFKPDANVTRAQFVTVLYRLSNSPTVTGGVPFTDISSQNAEFKTAIAWGYSNGYINGKASTIFDPDGTLTRQEAMKILYYYSGADKNPGMETMFSSIYDSAYSDSSKIAAWAKNPFYWGIYKEIITGTSENTLSPEGYATRAQLAKIMICYLDKYKK